MHQPLPDHAARPDHEVAHAGRGAGAHDRVDHRPRAGRNELGGFEHDRAAVRQRRRDLPRRDRDREVPRRDDPDHAEWLPEYVDVDAWPDAPLVFPGDPQRLAREEAEDLRRALDLADRLGARLSLLARELLAELL